MRNLSVQEAEQAGPKWLLLWVAVLVFLFPVVLATVKSAGSAIYTLLLLFSLYFGRGWRELEGWEKRLLAGFVVVFLVMLLSLTNTEDLARGVRRLEDYLRLVLIVPMYLMFRRFGWTMAWPLGVGAAVATVVMALQGGYQVHVQGDAVAIGAYQKIVFGDMAVLWGALAVVFAIAFLRGWVRLTVVVVVAVAALYASALSMTRMAWLFIPVFLLLLAWLYRKVLFSDRRVQVSVAVLLVLFGAALFWQADRLERGFERGAKDLRTFVDNPRAGTSWGVRLNLWRNTLLIVQDSPLLGTGLGDFYGDMQAMAEDGRSWSPAVAKYSHAHSIYFAALADAGVIGLLAMVTGLLVLPFLAFARGLAQAGSRISRFYAMAGLVLVLAYAVFGLSEAMWSRNVFINTYVVCMVVLLAGMVSRLRAEA